MAILDDCFGLGLRSPKDSDVDKVGGGKRSRILVVLGKYSGISVISRLIQIRKPREEMDEAMLEDLLTPRGESNDHKDDPETVNGVTRLTNGLAFPSPVLGITEQEYSEWLESFMTDVERGGNFYDWFCACKLPGFLSYQPGDEESEELVKYLNLEGYN